jgi:hypothetical protein
MTQFQIITDFRSIPLMDNTLYVLDFDETVVYFDGINSSWWKEQFNRHYNRHGDYDQADQETLRDWLDHVHMIQPNHIDKDGFSRIVEHCESSFGAHVMILTARNILLEDVTRSHLNTISPDKQLDIVFCSGDHKGEKLQEYLNRHDREYQHIIFVDDQIQNLINFKETHTDSRCYHMQCRPET